MVGRSEEQPGEGTQRAGLRCWSDFKVGWKLSSRGGRWVDRRGSGEVGQAGIGGAHCQGC